MKVKTRIINHTIPTPPLKYAIDGDAGIDLTATSKYFDEHGNVVYGTNRAFEIPKGYVGLLFPRSSCSKKDLIMANCVGVIDSNYRGEVTVKFKNSFGSVRQTEDNGIDFFSHLYTYEIGDRICQLIIMPYPQIEFEEVDELSYSERGLGGYGSTGD